MAKKGREHRRRNVEKGQGTVPIYEEAETPKLLGPSWEQIINNDKCMY
jgi:hypothetical protein